ncbi:hypothetical protein [uncultured Lamprocystis sp.]|jgi:hypothetical protein|uniref:hypothetical protein n=1 Tax=uncultured Lamprocystis sp. TaxID=543132 RepID=UPI0025E048A9|nr:hypothetical protein [uncultured Lamprocystis sp.]
MMTAYFEHESLPTLQAACRYVTEGNLNPKWKITITAHEMSPGVAVVRHPSRQAVMAVIGRMADTDNDTLVGVDWKEASTEV